MKGKEMDMKVRDVTVLALVATSMMMLVCGNGCGSSGAVKTGFLSDYSRLRGESENSLVYVDDLGLAKYSSFIVDPVKVHLYSGSQSTGNLTQEQITDLTSYMHSKLVEAVQAAGKKVVHQPGAGVARIRTALTDLKKTDAINIVPTASLAGLGVGGASAEMEVVDSTTKKQVAAAVETQKGSRIPLANLGDWTAAKAVMDDWAERVQLRLQ
jgi:hypothetical protein